MTGWGVLSERNVPKINLVKVTTTVGELLRGDRMLTDTVVLSVTTLRGDDGMVLLKLLAPGGNIVRLEMHRDDTVVRQIRMTR